MERKDMDLFLKSELEYSREFKARKKERKKAKERGKEHEGAREGAVEDMNRLPDTGNTNWDAVFAVDALRNVWWRNTGHDAPAKALNPASEFASFLRDGFGYLNVEASPVPAFRRWVAWCNATDREPKF